MFPFYQAESSLVSRAPRPGAFFAPPAISCGADIPVRDCLHQRRLRVPSVDLSSAGCRVRHFSRFSRSGCQATYIAAPRKSPQHQHNS